MIRAGAMLSLFDRAWRRAAKHATVVAAAVFLGGFLLAGISIFLGLHSVNFDGGFKGGARIELQTVKEVGYFWAPNWMLTSVGLLPLALLYLFRTRRTIEPLISELIERGMLVRKDGSRADKHKVLELWDRHSNWWSRVATVIFLAAVAFTIFADFIPVVLNWNLGSPEQISSFIANEGITLGHPTYEFDWSVASTFNGVRVPGWVNVIFDAFAYLLVPIFGSATMFSGLIWLFATHSVFNSDSLGAEGYKLQPDVQSLDERCGFEAFEEFFENLVRTTFLTAMIVVCMHLQNVYLRAPGYGNILDMLFGDKLTEMIQLLIANDVMGALSKLFELQHTMTTLDTSSGQYSPQSYIAVVALLMLAVILFGMVWGWLHSTAEEAKDDMLQRLQGEEHKDERERLENMRVWPIGWASINIVIAGVVIVAGCMIWTNFLLIVAALVLVVLTKNVIEFTRTALLDSIRRKKHSADRRP